MKQKDIAVVIIVAFLSGIAAFFVANKIFVTPENREQKVQIIDKLSSDFDKPDERFFNKDSINPSRNTTLQDTNQTPFNGTSQ